MVRLSDMAPRLLRLVVLVGAARGVACGGAQSPPKVPQTKVLAVAAVDVTTQPVPGALSMQLDDWTMSIPANAKINSSDSAVGASTPDGIITMILARNEADDCEPAQRDNCVVDGVPCTRCQVPGKHPITDDARARISLSVRVATDFYVIAGCSAPANTTQKCRQIVGTLRRSK
jgi:hypothetical protein